VSGLSLVRIDFHDRIFGLNSDYWLVWALRRLRGQTLRYEDLPPRFRKDPSKTAWETLGLKIAYGARYPVLVADQYLRPLVDRLFMLARKYGVMTCVARKPSEHG
jgi:hypothetical protein